MARYYFVSAFCPPLVLGTKPELSFKEFYDLLQVNLTSQDLKAFDHLLRPIDLYNIKALWSGLPLDERGMIQARELEEALLVRDTLPKYLVDFLLSYESLEERLRYFSKLYVGMYEEEEKKKGFLGAYFRMEREIRLVLTALRAKKYHLDLVKQFQFEDPEDPLVAEILAQKDGAEVFPPLEYEALKTLFMENGDDPKKLSFALLKFRLERIEEMGMGYHFSLDEVMAYGARLLIVESWDHLDRERGNVAVEELSRYG